ncbi:PREDICTED: CLK4-associating serine/arginine rich protein isoform X1 [Calidris pugnax]|uniref:CLK4-associating serine/arginine rich protein isoform X1 n=1 Tax=Calidris pugnax TaxID=198806 RepID=UPI00071E18C9|nr:PREDICTED: CLK4-associating serine/arginine rich protein isoform X1 [Calidris pugnax]
MMPWQGDTNNMIDRFDVRAHLDYIPMYTPPLLNPISPEQESDERKCNYERYRGLVQNDFAGISEEQCLYQIYIDELYGGLQKPNEDEKKKLAEKKASIGYTYEDSTVAELENSLEKRGEEEDSEEDSNTDEDEVIPDIDVEVDVDELNQEQVADLNKQATTYGMAEGDFVRMLRKDKEEAEAIKNAKALEEEKAMYSGRRSRRQRREFREKRLKGRKISPPSYARRDSPTYDPYKRSPSESTSESRSRSRTPSPGHEEKITFITSFGGSDEEAAAASAQAGGGGVSGKTTALGKQRSAPGQPGSAAAGHSTSSRSVTLPSGSFSQKPLPSEARWPWGRPAAEALGWPFLRRGEPGGKERVGSPLCPGTWDVWPPWFCCTARASQRGSLWHLRVFLEMGGLEFGCESRCLLPSKRRERLASSWRAQGGNWGGCHSPFPSTVGCPRGFAAPWQRAGQLRGHSGRAPPAWGRGKVTHSPCGTVGRVLPCGTTRCRGSMRVPAPPLSSRVPMPRPLCPFQETLLVLLLLPVLLLLLQLPLQLPLAPRRWLPPLQPLLPLPQPPLLALPLPQPPLLGRGFLGQSATLPVLFPRPGLPLRLPPPLQEPFQVRGALPARRQVQPTLEQQPEQPKPQRLAEPQQVGVSGARETAEAHGIARRGGETEKG